MKLFVPVKKISPLLMFVFLAACSNNQSQTITLQSDFDTYKYSSYVTANIKPESVDLEKDKTTNDDLNKQQIVLAKRQLSISKKKSTAKIANTVINNGLYKATKVGNDKNLASFASLDNVLTLALQNNLDIKSAKQKVTANLAKYDQVGFLEDTLNQYAAFTQTKKTAPFPLPGLLNLKSSIIDQSVETARLRLKQKIQDTVTQTMLAYYELQFSDAEIILIKKEIGLFKSLKQELQNNYSSNTGDLADILQVDIDIAKSRNSLQTIRDKRQTHQARLNALLNVSPALVMKKLDRVDDKNIKLSSKSKAYINQAQINRVEIEIMQSELAQMRKVIQLSQKRFYPDLDAGFSRFKNEKFSTKVKIKSNIVFGKDDSYLAETRTKMTALQSKIAALKTQTVADTQESFSKYQIANNKRSLYQNKVIPKAKVSLSIANNQYETGETNYVKVIKGQQMIVKYRLDSLTAIKELLINKAKLLRLVGKS